MVRFASPDISQKAVRVVSWSYGEVLIHFVVQEPRCRLVFESLVTFMILLLSVNPIKIGRVLYSITLSKLTLLIKEFTLAWRWRSRKLVKKFPERVRCFKNQNMNQKIFSILKKMFRKNLRSLENIGHKNTSLTTQRKFRNERCYRSPTGIPCPGARW